MVTIPILSTVSMHVKDSKSNSVNSLNTNERTSFPNDLNVFEKAFKDNKHPKRISLNSYLKVEQAFENTYKKFISYSKNKTVDGDLLLLKFLKDNKIKALKMDFSQYKPIKILGKKIILIKN